MNDGKEMYAKIKDVHLDEGEDVCEKVGTNLESGQIHMVLEPQNKDWKDQHLFIYNSKLPRSRLYQLLKQFSEMGIMKESEFPDYENNKKIFKEIKKRVGNRVIKFAEKEFGQGENKEWFPLFIGD